MPDLAARFRQVASVVRDEGAGALARRLLAFFTHKLRDSGDVIWMLRDFSTFSGSDIEPTVDLHHVESDAENERLDGVRPLLAKVRAARVSAGGERWYALDRTDGEIAFMCWTYSTHAIVSETPLVTLPLPDGVCQLEDSYVPATKRGGGRVRMAWDALCEQLAANGHSGLLTKADAENDKVLYALEQDGFKTVARVRGTVWFRRWTTWKVTEVAPGFLELRQLER
jgi:hypothetical protein